MPHCNMAAESIDGNIISFTIQDVPVVIDENHFVLAARSGSELLKYCSIRRMMDHLRLGENDVVEIDASAYTVGYQGGFYLSNEEGVRITSDLISNYKVLEHGKSGAHRILFSAYGHVFDIRNILGTHEGRVAIAGVRQLINPEDMQMSAGFRLNGDRVFFDDHITLWKGRPCMMLKEGALEVPSWRIL